jgi:hypothetical protein
MTPTPFASPGLFGKLVSAGMHSYCLGYATDSSGLIYLALAGYKTANRAIWAALMDNRYLEFDQKYLYRDKFSKYVHVAKLLPDSGAENFLLLTEKARVDVDKHTTRFYCLAATKQPPLERFLATLNRTVSVPLLAEWAEQLWIYGMRNSLVAACQAKGVHAWRVTTHSESWLAAVQSIVKKAGGLKC